jgi:hypothetical protein
LTGLGAESDISGRFTRRYPQARGLSSRIVVTKLVYIGGYGHSGSTLLEYLLAASPKVIACGEVASVLREGQMHLRATSQRVPGLGADLCRA